MPQIHAISSPVRKEVDQSEELSSLQLSKVTSQILYPCPMSEDVKESFWMSLLRRFVLWLAGAVVVAVVKKVTSHVLYPITSYILRPGFSKELELLVESSQKLHPLAGSWGLGRDRGS